MPIRSERAQFRLALSALLLLSALLVFDALGAGPLEVYDEGLYGMHAQHALRYGTWLHAVDASGAFPAGTVKFSKPPLSIWLTAATFRALGPSLFALRLPFALASVLLALIAFAWGCRLERGARGTWLGFTWGALWLGCHGAYHFGRTATIETLLAAFVLLALFAHARALRAEGRAALGWAAASGVAIALAFFTKQLVCALAVAPITIVELVRVRSEGLGRPLRRLLVALGVPGALALGWLGLLWAEVGSATLKVLWTHTIVKRVQGFDGLHHRNHLNRIAEQLDLDASPFSWQLGAIGLLLLVVRAMRTRQHVEDAWLLALAFACSWLTFDVASHAILPWYAVTLLPPLALGNAYLIMRGFAALTATGDGDRLDALAAALGGAALVLTVSDAMRTVAAAPLVVALAAAAVVACCVLPAEITRRGAPWLGAVAVVLATLGLFARDGYRYRERDPLATLGLELARAGVHRVSLDLDANIHPYAAVTFFGSEALAGKAPWNLYGAAQRSIDARLQAAVLPREAVPQPGQRLLRAPGLFAVVGDLARHPFPLSAASRALARGALTFEAEDFASERFDSLQHDDDASGAALRRIDLPSRGRAATSALAYGSTVELPAGSYRAGFRIALECGGFRGERLGDIALHAGRTELALRDLDCSELAAEHEGELRTLELAFKLVRPSKVTLDVRHDQGMIALDCMQLARAASGPDAKPRAPQAGVQSSASDNLRTAGLR